MFNFEVLELYEITPFSNPEPAAVDAAGFWSYTKLHHSQTEKHGNNICVVLELYEITPFSNTLSTVYTSDIVLELYEITPFSNYPTSAMELQIVLELYEITPFSNRFFVVPNVK